MQELTGPGPEPVELAPDDDDRGHSRSLGTDLRHDQPMPQVQQERLEDPEPDDGADGHGIQAPPEDRRRKVPHEVLPGPQLVREGQPGSEVGVEVERVPRLVAQPAAGLLHRGDDDHAERDGARDGEQHAGVVQDEVDDGAPEPEGRRRGVPEGDQDHVRPQEVDRGEPHESMPTGQLVLPVAALHKGDSRHEEDLDEEQVGGHQAGQPAQGDQGSCERPQAPGHRRPRPRER